MCGIRRRLTLSPFDGPDNIFGGGWCCELWDCRRVQIVTLAFFVFLSLISITLVIFLVVSRFLLLSFQSFAFGSRKFSLPFPWLTRWRCCRRCGFFRRFFFLLDLWHQNFGRNVRFSSNNRGRFGSGSIAIITAQRWLLMCYRPGISIVTDQSNDAEKRQCRNHAAIGGRFKSGHCCVSVG